MHRILLTTALSVCMFAAPAVLARRLADQVDGARWRPTRGLGHRRVLVDPAVVREVAEHVTRPIAIDDSGH